jgi:hypothetical protein
MQTANSRPTPRFALTTRPMAVHVDSGSPEGVQYPLTGSVEIGRFVHSPDRPIPAPVGKFLAGGN